MPDLWVAVRAALFYFLILGCGIAFLGWRTDASVATTPLISRLWLIEVLLCALCIYYILTGFGWAGAGFGRLRWRELVWLAPSVVVLATMTAGLLPVMLQQPLATSQWEMLAAIAGTSLLIGFSEEVMFRGILLRGALARFTISPAILISAVAFSLLHLMDGNAGQPVGNTLQELGFTFLMGLGLAPIALRIGSLWPLIIWHGLWDIVAFSSDALGVLHPFALPGMLIQVVVGLMVWRSELRRS